MAEQNLEVRGRVFRTQSDYAQALIDDKLIQRIEKDVDKEDPAAVSKLREELENGRYHFNTLVGDDYIDEIIDLDEKYRRNPPVTGKDGKNKKKGAGKAAKVKNKSLDDYDATMQQQILKEFKKNQLKRRAVLVFLALCILGSVGYLVFYFALYEKNDMEYTELAELKQEDIGGTVVINYEEAKDKPPVLKKYETLYQKNRKLVGWITIEGCGIDYPVMQTSNNDYYLDHNYNQDYDKNGSIFMDKDCTPAFPNDNMIIYGHHMKSGKMFGNLNYYAKKDFWEKNQTFMFDTIYETGTYAVMYVFRSKIYSQEEIVFKYYQFIDAASADEFESNMDAMAEMSLYDTGVTAVYGDKLITLSTCDSAEGAEGRFVVVAKKIK
ncbi:MAG: class B sortase [Lachnospiraceae bacterium]|nr:class B sortase [Lachnospiraceae bacterium]